jgi:hypothetical protein
MIHNGTGVGDLSKLSMIHSDSQVEDYIMLSMKRMNLKIVDYHLKSSFFVSCIKKLSCSPVQWPHPVDDP